MLERQIMQAASAVISRAVTEASVGGALAGSQVGSCAPQAGVEVGKYGRVNPGLG